MQGTLFTHIKDMVLQVETSRRVRTRESFCVFVSIAVDLDTGLMPICVTHSSEKHNWT
jgi:hypothetical protein